MSFTESLREVVERNSSGLLSKAAHWGRAPLGSLATITNGFPFPSAQFSRERGFPLLRIRDILSGDTETRVDGPVPPEFVVQPGELVVGMDGDFNCALWRGPAAALNQRVCKVTPNEAFCLRKWVAFALQPYLDAINASTSALTVKHLSSKTIAEIPLPIPPLAEQHRVVAAIEEHLSQLDVAIAGIRRVQALIPRCRAALLGVCCTDRAGADRSGLIQALGDNCSLITSGSRGWAAHYSSSGPLFIRAQDINTDRLVLDTAARVTPPDGAEGRRTRVFQGDLLVTITGANVTKTALVDRDLGEAYVSQHVALVRLTDTRDSKFAYYWLISPYHGRRDLERVAYGAGKPGLNLTQLRELEIWLPDRIEQKHRVEILEGQLTGLATIEKAIDAQVARADQLRQSVLRNAFEGRLVQQDSRDEPAGVLLDRIRTARPDPVPRRGRAARRPA